MKIRTNLRAGKGGTGGGSANSGGANGGHGADNAPGAETPVYVPPPAPVVRCPGY